MNPSIPFYDALAPLFDVMTDWEARLATEGPFLQAVLAEIGARRVLDAACGSGGHALWLAQQGFEAVGVDASPAMIELARRKTVAAGVDVTFDVQHLTSQTPPLAGSAPPFDAVLCLGNSLPHLLTQDDLVAALRRMAAALRPGGLFVTQNLNYDLRWRTQPRWFGVQGGMPEGHEALVWRFADYDCPARRIAFHVALFARGEQGWGVQVHTTPQRPLFLADLAAALAEAGFDQMRAYGRIALPLEPFDADRAGDLVVVARKVSNI